MAARIAAGVLAHLRVTCRWRLPLAGVAVAGPLVPAGSVAGLLASQ